MLVLMVPLIAALLTTVGSTRAKVNLLDLFRLNMCLDTVLDRF